MRTEKRSDYENMSRRLGERIKRKKKGGWFLEAKGHEVRVTIEDIERLLLRAEYGDVCKEELEAANRAFVKSVPLDHFVDLQAKGDPIFRCGSCGEYLAVETNGVSFRPRSSCPYPEGLLIKLELNVPSGKLVVGRDLRKVVSVYCSDRDSDLMATSHDMARLAKVYARAGCIFLPVGNTGVNIYRLDRKRLLAAAPTYRSGREIPPKGKYLTTVSGGLWWYSIMDKDEYLRRGGNLVRDDADEISVEPGVYFFTHRFLMRNFDSRLGVIKRFTKIDWLHPPDPWHDLSAPYRSLQLTAGQVVHAYLRLHFPWLPHTIESVQYVVNNIFYSADPANWHPNGFYLRDQDVLPTEPEIEIPVFEGHHAWSSLRELTSLRQAVQGKIPLNSSFLLLARNVLNNLARAGRLNERGQNRARTQDRAKEWLTELERRYSLVT